MRSASMKSPQIQRNSGSIPTRHGDVRATAYHPPHGRPDHGAYINFHAGGYVVGNYGQDDPFCRYLAARAHITVINVDYALAPKRRFPIPVEQAYDVLCLGGK